MDWTVEMESKINETSDGSTSGDIDVTTGNTYKDLLESTSMGNGLEYVLFINVVIGALGLAVFVLFNFKHTRLSSAEMELLQRYPSPQVREEPGRLKVTAPPPMLWTTFSEYLFGDDSELGEDAQLYLLFLRKCVLVTLFLGVASCTILIPTYFFGGGSNAGRFTSTTTFFTATTAHGIHSDSLLLYLQIPVWILVCIGLSLLFGSVHVFAGRERYEWQSSMYFTKRWMLFLRELPPDLEGAGELERLLRELYSDSVDYVELVYAGQLSESRRQKGLGRLGARIDYFERHLENSSVARMFAKAAEAGERIHPRAQVSFAWIRWKNVNSKLEDLREQVIKLSGASHEESKFLRCAFVSFSNEAAASRCLKEYRETTFGALFNIFRPGGKRRRLDARNRLRGMVAEFAPKPKDVIWKNVGIGWWQRAMSQLGVQLWVFLILVLFTSPLAILWGVKQVFTDTATVLEPFLVGFGRNDTTPDQWLADFGGAFSNVTSDLLLDENSGFRLSDTILDILPDFLTDSPAVRAWFLSYAPTLLLTVINALVPSVLRMLSVLEKYKTRSELEVSVLRKTIFYMIMNLIILPAFAMNTASQLVKYIYGFIDGESKKKNVDWLLAVPISERLYTGDLAFFLCNYLVQLAFTGNIQWLLIPTHMASQAWRTKFAMTKLEVAESKCVGLFDYPRHYAYLIVTMSVCLLFGAMAPLLWMFAWMFLLFMYLVDRYNVRYTYCRSHTDYRLPRTGANFLLFWCTLSVLVASLNYYVNGLRTAAVCLLVIVIIMLGFNLWRRAQFEVWVLRGANADMIHGGNLEPVDRAELPNIFPNLDTSGSEESALLKSRRSSSSWFYSVQLDDVEERQGDEDDLQRIPQTAKSC